MADASTSHDSSIVESIQSLVVAFVLAMTFRGFVTEGFVIPTGSMAPTLMGKHVLLKTKATGVTFPLGLDENAEQLRAIDRMPDPMLGPNFPGAGMPQDAPKERMGDRILVIKCLYPFNEPRRYDVVVFKNPTGPDGASANYIKRLVGLPGERIWLADGDVFAAPNEDGVEPEEYRIQRKPEYVQRAVWQSVHDSDFVPRHPERLRRRWQPWTGEQWDTDGRAFICTDPAPSTLTWDSSVRAIDDWTSYDPNPTRDLFPVADIRVSASIEAETPEALATTLRISARQHDIELSIRGGESGGTAEVRMREIGTDDPWVGSGPPAIDLDDSTGTFNVEFWHVDQAMWLFFDGKRVAYFEYDWSGRERTIHAMGVAQWDMIVGHSRIVGRPPSVRWTFEGSPVTLRRVRFDRDLFYRPDGLTRKAWDNPTQPGFEHVFRDRVRGMGTHPLKPAMLNDEQYFMLGDNSQASLDSRAWGNPHPLVAEQVDPTPFVVNRKLIIGKAWVVYFPAPYHFGRGGVPVIPDFGRLRFIR